MVSAYANEVALWVKALGPSPTFGQRPAANEIDEISPYGLDQAVLCGLAGSSSIGRKRGREKGDGLD